MKADYDANPTSPATHGGRLYKVFIDDATTNDRWRNLGEYGAFAYHITGDSAFAQKAWDKLNEDPYVGTGGFLARADCTEYGVHYSRENMVRLVQVYDWIYDWMDAGQRTTFLDQLNAQAACTVSNYRVTDTDQTVGDYMGVAALVASTGSYNSTVMDIWNDAGNEFGGFTATAADTSTRRNTIKFYIENLSAGGEWLESGHYNRGTLTLLLMGADAIKTTTGVDYFPEINSGDPSWLQQAGSMWLHCFRLGSTLTASLTYGETRTSSGLSSPTPTGR